MVEALIGGPLAIVGVEEQARRAAELRAEGHFSEAADRRRELAGKLAERNFESVADIYLDGAAEAFGEAGELARAAEIGERVVRGRLERFDRRALHDALQLKRWFGLDHAWLAEGLAALAAWPEQEAALIGS